MTKNLFNLQNKDILICLLYCSHILEKKEFPKVTKKLENVECVEKDTVTLECEIIGKPKPTYTWLSGEKELKESDDVKFEVEDKTYRLVLNSAKVADSGLYTIRAKNAAGECSSSCRLTVKRKCFLTLSPLQSTLVQSNQ